MANSKETREVEIIIKGQQATASVKELKETVKILTNQYNNLAQGSDAARKKMEQLQVATARLQSIRNEIRNVNSSFLSIAASAGKFAFGFGGVVALVGGVKRVFSDAIRVHSEFESSVANLSAITGATGKDLEFYKEQAREMGLTTEGGAKGVVEAFKLIGSAKPELLKNKEALADVTKQAILLSKAAGLDVPDAAKRLTDALNQFGAPAADAAKYVDILAAGAKAGAAEIPDITDALLKFGVAAKSSNISIQESVGAIELLAEKGLKGADAGTALRNVFSKLSASSVLPKEALAQLERADVDIKVLSDTTLPLQARLKELSKISGNAAVITQVFGLENKIAGEVLVGNLARLEALTKAVDENGVAQSQSATNTDTFKQATLEAGNAYDNLLIEITEGDFGAIIKGFVKVGTAALHELTGNLRDVGLFFKNGFSGGGQIKGFEMLDKATTKMADNMRNLTKEERLNTAQGLINQAEKIKKLVDGNTRLTKEQKTYLMNQASSALQFALKIRSIDQVAAKEAESTTKKGFDTRTKAEIKADDKIASEREKLLEKIAGLEIEYYQKGLDSDTKEIANVHHKYKILLKEAGDSAEEGMRIQKLYNKEIEDVLQKQAIEEQKRNAEKLLGVQKLQDEIYLATLSANDRELVVEMSKWDELILKAEAAGLDVTALRQAEADAINAIVISQKDKEVAKTEQANAKTIQLEKEKRDKILGYVQEFASKVDGIMSSYDTIQKNRESEELRRNNERLTAEGANNSELLKAKLIDQKEYDKRTLEAKKAHDKVESAVKKKAYEREQKLAISQAIIAGALGIARIWAAYSSLAFVGVPLAVAQSVVEAAAVGMQVAAITSAPSPYAEGGFNKESDNPQGFTSGATLFTKSASGTPFIAGEAGMEWIAPNWMTEAPETAPIIEHLETIRQTRSFASGGSTQSSSSTAKPVFSQPNTTIANNNESNDRLANAIEQLVQNGVAAYLDYDGHRKTLDKIDNAQKSSRVG